MKDLEKLFVTELEDMYDGEQQLVDALSEMEESAASGELKSAFHEHLEQTRTHVNRLESVFRAIGQEPHRRSCKGLEGIIDEGEKLAKEFRGNSALDAGLIASGQKAEHYEITSYGTLCSWAEELGNAQIAALLQQNLQEEKETDEKLTRLAEGYRNPEAARRDTEKKGEGLFSKLTGS